MISHAEWEEQIRTDLGPYADPGTLLQIDRQGATFKAKWQQRRREMKATFSVSIQTGIKASFKGKTLSYREFFACEDMADIEGIAKTSGNILSGGVYVETKAFAEQDSTNTLSALTAIANSVATRPEEQGLTNFVMVTGEAGAGKTSALKELVRRQAENYVQRRSDFVYLYINAQGRALARFNEALATELNELRVHLPYHSVAGLVRLGLVVPVIDGFDELLGVGGYDDAFGSIASFVEELNGQGAIVASARSTYYEQEFLARVSRLPGQTWGSWKLSSITVLGWTREERENYLEQVVSERDGLDLQDLQTRMRKVFQGKNEALADKPLFVARVCDSLIKGIEFLEDRDLLEQLVIAFLERERREKLLRRNGDPMLNGDQLKSLYCELAEEMWNLGTRELDRASVRDVAYLVVDDLSLNSAEKTTIIERVSSMAFLQPGETGGSVSFEHELFFDYFLGFRMSEVLRSNQPNLTLLISRSSMGEALADGIAERLHSDSSGSLSSVVGVLSMASSRSGSRRDVVRENSGRIVGALLGQLLTEITGLNITSLIFPGSRLSGVKVARSSFEDCEFRRCDLSGAVFAECTSVRSKFELPLVDAKTKLGIAGLETKDFLGIRFASGSEVQSIYDPYVLVERLLELGLPSLKGIDKPRVRAIDSGVMDIVERIARAFGKCNPICLQDDYLQHIFTQTKWQDILAIGLETEIFRLEKRPANGPRRKFLRRLVRPEDLIAGAIVGADVPENVNRFWNKVEKGVQSRHADA
jgi:hypothetical protein